ncbi:MAG: hypothetical protein Q7V58_14685 [Actinomycetota bacterium]|nr:hypothetical protein [Actinomycetota bacterium]
MTRPHALSAALALGVASALALGACSSDAATSDPTNAAASASATASPSPSVTDSATPSPTPTPTPVPTASGPGVGTVVPDESIGLHVAGVQEGAWPDKNVPIGSLRLWDAGTNWSQVEAVKGVYNWTALDTALKTADRNGIDDVLLVLGGTPTWNASRVRAGDYPVPGAASPPKSLAAWDAFVTAVAKRYAGRISAYQIWNEASLAMFWNGTPEKLALMTQRAATIIRAADPKATVVAASTTVRLPGAFDRFFSRYLAALAELGWPVDVLAAHLYPASKGTPDERAAFIAQVRQALATAGAPDLPVWDTELNYGLAGPGPTNPRQTIRGAEARDWVVQTSLDSLHLGIARTYWYIWTPEPYALLGMQLTNDSGAVSGLRIVDQWTVGSTWQGCVDDGATVACSLERKGVSSVIAWAKDEAASYTPPAGLSQACTTDNACAAVAGAYALGETPVRFLP